MSRTLYDLAGAEPDRRFSPYCWRTKLALAHKGLDVDTVPWRFNEKGVIAFSGQGRVPVLVDGEQIVADSWTIATYLEDTYPDQPSLFGGDGGRAVSRFINGWADGVVLGGMIRFIVHDIYGHLHDDDRGYFRQSREQRFGMKLEELGIDRETKVATFRQSLEPMRTMLATQPYFGGAAPAYADYAVFGCFQWARCISPFQVLANDDPVAAWRERLLGAFDGLARKAVGYPCDVVAQAS